MFGLGFTELLLIMVVALVVFGPQRLPEIARTLGKTMGELRKAMDEIKYDISSIDYDAPQNRHNPGTSPQARPVVPQPALDKNLAGTCEATPAAAVPETAGMIPAIAETGPADSGAANPDTAADPTKSEPH